MDVRYSKATPAFKIGLVEAFLDPGAGTVALGRAKNAPASSHDVVPFSPSSSPGRTRFAGSYSSNSAGKRGHNICPLTVRLPGARPGPWLCRCREN